MFSSFLVAVALCIFLIQLSTSTLVGYGLLRLRKLRDIAPDLTENVPRVSIVVPACNEAGTITAPLKSLLRQDYPNLEIIVVNDRSTDGTGALLEEIQDSASTPFSIITIEHLPTGWLGKANALSVGAAKASGSILLFTDADIAMEPTAISRAVTVMERDHVDHLSLIFQATGGNWILNGVILDAASGLLAMFRPWKAEDPKSNSFMGVGAFNMVRKECYRRIGGHDSIRMHPVDDIMLGKIIKGHGYRQICMLGQSLIKVCWYDSVKAMIEGLMKNVFSMVHYRTWLIPPAILSIFLLTVLPFWAIFFTTDLARFLFMGALLIRLVSFFFGAILAGMGVSTIAGGLISPYISMYILGRGTYTTLKNNGIHWRGTHYPLEELRKSSPLLF